MSDDTTAIQGEVVSNTTDIDLAKFTRLITAFHNKYNVTEACHFAEISRDTFYRWNKDITLSEKIAEARRMPNRRAKEVVTEAINSGDVTTARWLLDRTDPDFKPKAEVDNNTSVVESDKKIKEFLDEPDDGAYDDVSAEPVAGDEPEATDEVATTTPDIS